MKPEGPNCKTYCPQEAQQSRDHNQLPNDRATIWENRVPIGTGVNLHPGQQDTNIQYQGQSADETLRIRNSLQFSGNPLLDNASFFHNAQSFQNNFETQTQFSLIRQSEVTSSEQFGANYNRNMGSPFDVGQMNLFERVSNQPHSLFQRPSLRHDQLHSDFLNRELLVFDTDSLQSTEEQLSNTEITANFIESTGRELEQSNEASQFSSIIVEEDLINQHGFSNSDVYIDGSNQASDLQLEQSNHSSEFHSQFYETSTKFDKIVEKKIWDVREDKSLKKTEDKKRTINEKNTYFTAVFENWTSHPEIVTTSDESSRQGLTSSANLETGRLGVIDDHTTDTVMSQEVDKNNPKVVGGSVIFNNHEETLFYESTMKEIDAIDSVLSFVERNMEIDSNSYDLKNAKNIETFQHIECINRGTESFIPGTVEITVMPLIIQPGESPEAEDPEETSEAHNSAEESNISGTWTTLENVSCQETSSQCAIENDQLLYEVATTSATPSSELCSLNQMQQIEPFYASTGDSQSDNIQKKTDVKPEGINSESDFDCFNKKQRNTPETEIIQTVGETDRNPVDDTAIISKSEEKSQSEQGMENIIPETTDTTLPPEHLLPSVIILQKNLEIPHLTGELPGSNSLNLSGEIVMNEKIGSQTETENQDNSTEVLSAENVSEKGFEDKHRGLSLGSGVLQHLDETQTITFDNKRNYPSTLNDTTTIDKAQPKNHKAINPNQESEIKANEIIDLVMPLEEKNTQSSENDLPLNILPEQQLPFIAKIQETSDIQNPTGELAQPNISENSSISIRHPLGKEGSQIETNIEKSPKVGTSTEDLSLQPTSLPQILEPISSSSPHGAEEDNTIEKRFDDEHGRGGEPDSNEIILETLKLTPNIEANQGVDKNDTTVINEPVVFEKAEENQYHDSKMKVDKEIEKTTHTIETGVKHTKGGTDNIVSEPEGMTESLTPTLSEHQLPCITKTQENSEKRNPAVGLQEQNETESTTILETVPLEKIGSSQNEKKMDQPSKKESSVDASSGEPSSLTETQHIPIPDEPSIQETIHDNIEIHISPSELAWLSEPETQSQIRSHPCIEQLENYQIEQVPLTIEGMLQITEPSATQNEECTDLSGQMYFEQSEGSSLSEVPATDEKNPSSEPSPISKKEHVSTQAEPQSVTSSAPLPPSSSMVLSAHEPTVVGSEPEPSDNQEPSDDAGPPAKKKRTVSKPPMKSKVMETRKSSRYKKIPDRLFYIGRGQLF